MDTNMNNRHQALAALALASLLLSGCAAAAGAEEQSSPTTSLPSSAAAAKPSSSAAAEPSHAGGHNHGSSSSPAATKTDGPSAAALMVCGDQPKDRLASILNLDTNPHTINDWADSTFTCTYHLDEGALKISVKETKDQPTALTHFDAMQALAKDATPIKGLANLGFPAYETADGSAVFQKDSFVLQVDATDLPATLGPEGITRNALAYQLSTTILACWIEHP
jgi:outer membrane murein-binding lipoprotein Lpp